MHYMDSDAMLEISIRAPKEQAKNSFAQLHHVAAVLEATKQNEDDKHLNLTSFEIRTDGAVCVRLYLVSAQKKIGRFMR